MKRQRKELKKGWKKLKTAFKWLFLVIVLFWLLSLLGDFLDHYNLLVEKVSQQGNQIELLQGQLNEVTELNAQLSDQLQLTQAQLELEQMRVDELINEKLTQQVPKVNIGGQPITMTEEDVRAEIEPQLELPKPDLTVPIVVVGALQILKSLVFRVPAF